MKRLFILNIILCSILYGNERESSTGIIQDSGGVTKAELTGSIYFNSNFVGTKVVINNVFYGEGSFLAEGLPLGLNKIIAKKKGCNDYIKAVNVRENKVDTITVLFKNPYRRPIGFWVAGGVTAITGIPWLFRDEKEWGEHAKVQGIVLISASAVLNMIAFIKLHKRKDWERENLISINPNYDLSNDKYGLSLNVRF